MKNGEYGKNIKYFYIAKLMMEHQLCHILCIYLYVVNGLIMIFHYWLVLVYFTWILSQLNSKIKLNIEPFIPLKMLRL